MELHAIEIRNTLATEIAMRQAIAAVKDSASKSVDGQLSRHFSPVTRTIQLCVMILSCHSNRDGFKRSIIVRWTQHKFQIHTEPHLPASAK